MAFYGGGFGMPGMYPGMGMPTQVVGYDGIPLSGSDADFLAYAARWQAAGKPGAIVSSAPSSAPPPPPPPAGWEVYAKQTDTAGFIKKMAISDGKLIKITNDKKELLQPHWQISVPDTYKLVEAAFVLPAPTDPNPFPNSLLVKLTKPGSFEQPSVLQWNFGANAGQAFGPVAPEVQQGRMPTMPWNKPP